MAEVIDIFDGGIENIKGRNVGKIIFKIVTNEGKPEEMTGLCLPHFRDSIIKNLKRLHFGNGDKKTER